LNKFDKLNHFIRQFIKYSLVI